MAKKRTEDENQLENQLDEQYQEHTEESYQYDRVKDYEGKGYHSDPIKRHHALMHDEIYIRERLMTQRDWYDQKATYNQKMYKRLKRWEFILAASIPVVISVSTMTLFKETVFVHGATKEIDLFTLSDFFQVLAAVSGILLVVINKLLELEEYYKNWKDYRATNERLEQERLLYLTRTEPYDEENAFPMLVENVEEMLSKQLQRWKHVAKSPKLDAVNPSKVKPDAALLDSPDEDLGIDETGTDKLFTAKKEKKNTKTDIFPEDESTLG